MSDDRCTCPSLEDVLWHPFYTKDPCPVHPEPELPEGIFVEPIDVHDFKINTEPLR